MEFTKNYFFLSNAYQCPLEIEIGGVTHRFMCAEAAFQACRAPMIAGEFEGMTSREAKERGKHAKKAEVRQDWDEIKMDELARVLDAKFANSSLRMKLLSIKEPIVMENTYKDRYWGVCDGRGQNRMGKALEAVKERIETELGIFVQKEPSVVSYKVQKGGIVAFDTETTGTSSKYDDILQITIVGQDGSVLLDTYVKPQNCKSWDDAMAVNHITPEMVENAPSADKVAEVVKKIFDNADAVVGHNIGFDIKMVQSRFGYDFAAKEQQIRNSDPQAVESAISCAKARILYVVSYAHQLAEASIKKKDYPECLLKNNTYKKLKEHKYKPEEMTEEDVDRCAVELADSVYIFDTLKDFRQWDAENGVSRSGHKLIDAMKEFFPMEAAAFEAEAHDACADTLATLKVAIKLNKLLGRELPLGQSVWEDKLFGVTEGIVCHQVNCQGVTPKNGFTHRLFSQFPILKEQYRECFHKCQQAGIDQFGKVRMDEVDRGLFTATIYSQKKAGNHYLTGLVYTDKAVLVDCVARVCDKYPGTPVYLPVVHQDGVITDGIGCGRAGLTWEELGPEFAALNKKNLFTIDTQTGQIFPFYREMNKEVKQEEDFDMDSLEIY